MINHLGESRARAPDQRDLILVLQSRELEEGCEVVNVVSMRGSILSARGWCRDDGECWSISLCQSGEEP